MFLFHFTGNKGDSALLITSDDKVLCVGENRSGCLGTGDTLAYGLPYEISLSKKKVKGKAKFIAFVLKNS